MNRPEQVAPHLRNAARPFGASVRRHEDPRILLGRTQYVDDVRLPDMLAAAFLRSHHAHARIVGIDCSAARALSGVEAVFTAADFGAALPEFHLEHDPASGFPAHRTINWPMLARERVRHVGEAVAVVIARDRYVAEDAVSLIKVEYEPLPVVAHMEAALAADAPRLIDGADDNLFQDAAIAVGDIEDAFGDAVVVSDRFVSGRHLASPMECRGIVAAPDRTTGGLVIWASTQMPFVLRSHIAEKLGMPENDIRIIAGDVGGGFGLKAHIFAEDFLIPLIARKLGRPVKWIEDRREHIMSMQAKEQVVEASLAVEPDGRIRGLRADILCDMGAYTEYPWPNYEAHITASALAIQYKLPSYHCRYRTVVTNKSPSGAYRGIGQPVAVFVLERLLDMAARKLGMDPAEIRRINMVGEDEYPCTTALGTVIESGSHRASLDAALAAIGYEDFRRAQARARNAGRHMGIGIAHYVEMTAPGTPLWKMIGARLSGFEPALVRIERDGRVTVTIGVNSQGQSHETVFAQLAADVLGVAIGEVRVVQGDSAMMPRGGAVGGSKSAVATGGAVLLAAQKLRERLAAIVAVAKEVPADAVEIRGGVIYDRGSNTALCTLAEAAREVWMGNWGLEQEDKGLEVLVHYEPPLLTHSNATHVATVEVDPETGGVRILRYVVAEDCGRLINPRVVDGQVQGGIAQGIGQALYEEVVHDAAGQILNGTLMDYLLPTAMDVPAAEIDHIETPSPHTMGGIKGAGEGGKIAPPAAIANAVADALAPFNVRANRLPLTPERILEMIAGGPLPASAAEAHTEAARDMNGEGFAIRGEHHVRAAREALWALLLDPERLARCLPGCRRLEIVGDHEYAGEMKIGIAGIRGVYAGRVKLSRLDPPRAMDLAVTGSGKQGFLEGRGHLELREDAGGTWLRYAGRVKVGGPLAAVGARMFNAAAEIIIGQVFIAIEAELAAGPGRPARQGVILNFLRYLLRRLSGR